jgi:hypothetical protein
MLSQTSKSRRLRMFRYPLMTRIADKLIQFLEMIAAPDKDAIEIVLAFHMTMRAVLTGRITGSAAVMARS